MRITCEPARRLLLALALGLLLIGARGLGKLENAYGLLEQGKSDKAAVAFQQALAEFKRKGIKVGVALAYEGLGDVERARGREDAAVVFYHLGVELPGCCPRETIERLQTKRYQLEDLIYQRLTASAPDRWETYDRFLATHPENRNAVAARERRDGLQYKPVLEKGTLAAYVDFVETFPENLFVPKAVERIYAIWQQDFTGRSAAEALANYDRFLGDFPSSRLRAAAMTMKSYYTALLASSSAPFADFYEEYNATKVPILGTEELAAAARTLERIADTEGTATPYLLLYENVGSRRFFESAFKAIKDAREESYFVRRNPGGYFTAGQLGNDSQLVSQKEMLEGLIERSQKEGAAGLLAAAYVPKLETTTRPVFEWPVYSHARFGTYQVTMDVTMKVKVTWRMTGVLVQVAGGLSGQRTSGENTEIYKTTVTAVLSPQGSENVQAVFGELTTNVQQSFVGLAGMEQTREVADLTSAITSVSLVGPAGAKEWKIELAKQDGQSFGEAARQFNTLSAMGRSPQIDQMEETLVRGIAHALTDGGASAEPPITIPPGHRPIW
ncbi:MAG: hypothetical protein WAM82_16330 [Thermoanaerobaculia bacterium]